jgi:hypothetical protein
MHRTFLYGTVNTYEYYKHEENSRNHLSNRHGHCIRKPLFSARLHPGGASVKFTLSVRPYAHNNSKTAERIFVAFGVEVMPFVASPYY